jgi:hypothetical protein
MHQKLLPPNRLDALRREVARLALREICGPHDLPARRHRRYGLAIDPESSWSSPPRSLWRRPPPRRRWPHEFARFRVPSDVFLSEYDSKYIHGVYGEYVGDLVWAPRCC